jgi:hypothetical protein
VISPWLVSPVRIRSAGYHGLWIHHIDHHGK